MQPPLHQILATPLFTFRVSRTRREMYCGHARLCVCVCVSVCLCAAACLHYCTDPDVTSESGRECRLVVHYWADLQSVHGLRCYGNIMRTRNASEYMLVLYHPKLVMAQLRHRQIVIDAPERGMSENGFGSAIVKTLYIHFVSNRSTSLNGHAYIC